MVPVVVVMTALPVVVDMTIFSIFAGIKSDKTCQAVDCWIDAYTSQPASIPISVAILHDVSRDSPAITAHPEEMSVDVRIFHAAERLNSVLMAHAVERLNAPDDRIFQAVDLSRAVAMAHEVDLESIDWIFQAESTCSCRSIFHDEFASLLAYKAHAED